MQQNEKILEGSNVKILVTGSREWDDLRLIYQVLEKLPENSVVIHGDCLDGADHWADSICRDLGINKRVYPAKWKKYGKKAGPLRNQEMLDSEGPDLVLAFFWDYDKSRGTKDMVKRALREKVPTLAWSQMLAWDKEDDVTPVQIDPATGIEIPRVDIGSILSNLQNVPQPT